MAAADYRLMTEATGQRIAIALENLAGFGAYLTTSDVVNNLTIDSANKVASQQEANFLYNRIRYVNGFEGCTFTLANQAFASGVNTFNVTFDHELSSVPSFLLCSMPQTSVWFVSSYALSKTGATVRLYSESGFTATSLTVYCLAVL